MPDISQLVKASGIDAQRTATDLFGMAVEQFGANPLNDVLRSLSGQPQDPSVNRNDGSWYATSYAASLANSHFRPKLKFMFRVEFLFKDKVLEQFGRANWQRNFTFLVSKVDRPKVDFEYEEINEYNFRTKVLKRILHKDLSMSFIDDVGNNVYEFFRFMMMVHSPITRRSIYTSQNITDVHEAFLNGSGMEFTEGLGQTNDYAQRGVVNTDVGSPLQAIKVTQLFLDQTNKIDTATRQVSFFFINPRVVSFDLDELDHSASEYNTFNMAFDFDFMVMSRQDPMEKLSAEKMVSPSGSAPGDVTPYNTGITQSGSDPYTAIIAGVAGSAAQKITSETIGREIRKVPGLGSVADTIGSISQGIAKSAVGTLGSVASSITQSSARPARDVISDSTVVSQVHADYTSSTGGFGADQPGADNGVA